MNFVEILFYRMGNFRYVDNEIQINYILFQMKLYSFYCLSNRKT